MQASPRASALIKGFEGLRLESYWDGHGRCWTVGYGHTRKASEGQRLSQAEAEALFREDLEQAERAVTEATCDVPLTQQQFDALCAFVFNVGAAALKRSTLLRRLKDGIYRDAADEFSRWVYAGGVKLPGLVLRRAAERALFLEGTPK